MGKLVLFMPDSTTREILLDHERVTVGRRPSNDVCLPYPTVSAAHAVFVTVPTGVVMEDLGSTNGTTVNGKRVPRHFLHDGDRIDIGRQTLLYFADVDAIVPPLPRRAPAKQQADDERGGAAAGGATIAVASRPVAAAGAPEASGPEPAADAAAETREPSWGRGKGVAQPLPAAAGSTFPPPMTDAVVSGPVLKVVTGPNAGRTVALIKDETLIGRAGTQVAAVRKVDQGVRLLPAEGAEPPRVNGVPVPGEGLLLRPGDAIEIAGTQLVFLMAEDRSPS